ncbi:thiazole biosynthesis adenylyltransferase ThiF [Xylanibacillus composti]|uniref:Thiamine/molybdopterin biosynthesis protein MoeB n=1 Tax=Xylanibacillus composti TaxID=1572762 RepID=A0A8J4M2I1_9BACL|nr:ThiF family adenylyltransferase [Xylanibacillus composti]MDT9724762.1 thiazole biosynthesis adenylyltransferase ThiF [Xylanibacillus composti]GIQ69885.1 thiamine/molybdopterin biosynthesis protein MoeB [Xylanibacillus composti]
MNERYSRQHLFAPIGRSGQEKLARASIAIVGMGALGSALADMAARAGIGEIRLIDRDFVEFSNLQRQMLYDESDASRYLPKTEAAAIRLAAINSEVSLIPRVADLHAGNAEELLHGTDLILDGSDNFTVRYLLNDYAIKMGIPYIYGGAVASRGVCYPVLPERGPCLRCLFPNPPERGTAETCDTAGVISPIIHAITAMQMAEALKCLVGDLDAVQKQLVQLDLWRNHWSQIDVSQAKRPDCPACAERRFEFLDDQTAVGWSQTMCGRNSVQIRPAQPASLDFDAMVKKLSPVGRVERTPFLLRFMPDDTHTLVLFPDGRALIQGTEDPTMARSLYSRYVGD